MTDTVEAIVAEMRERVRLVDRMTVSEYADRLQSAHDAEVGALRRWNESVAVFRDHTAEIVDAPCVVCRAESAESRLREAERDARRYRWLRVNGGGPCDILWHHQEAELDAAIDRAMEGEDG